MKAIRFNFSFTGPKDVLYYTYFTFPISKNDSNYFLVINKTYINVSNNIKGSDFLSMYEEVMKTVLSKAITQGLVSYTSAEYSTNPIGINMTDWVINITGHDEII